MTIKTFQKILSANDVGHTGGHQGGMLIPKGQSDLIGFLPALQADHKNPDAWVECIAENGAKYKFRFVYYNNSMHDEHGTRDEYRLTHMTQYFSTVNAHVGDVFQISKKDVSFPYSIRIIHAVHSDPLKPELPAMRIRLSGWSQVH